MLHLIYFNIKLIICIQGVCHKGILLQITLRQGERIDRSNGRSCSSRNRYR